MNTEEAIEALDIISDVLLELNDQFDIEIIFDSSAINIESEYTRVANIIGSLIGSSRRNRDIDTLEFRIITKKSIAYFDFHDAYEKRNQLSYIRRKKLIGETTLYIMSRIGGISKRLSSMLTGYNLKIIDPNYIQNGGDFPFLLIGTPDGLIRLPLYKGSLSDEKDIIKMRKMDISSYEEDKEIVDNHKDIQSYYAYVSFEISKAKPRIFKKTFKDRIKKFIDFL